MRKQILVRFRKIYNSQSWYDEDVYIFEHRYSERYITNFGHDCRFRSLTNGRIIHSFDKYVEILSLEETKTILRNQQIGKLIG